jgi:hypothetical protein
MNKMGELVVERRVKGGVGEGEYHHIYMKIE